MEQFPINIILSKKVNTNLLKINLILRSVLALEAVFALSIKRPSGKDKMGFGAWFSNMV